VAANEPVDPRIRLAITQWPDDAPRGAVTTFCEEHEISRKTFYAIRARALTDGQAAALEPRSRRPRTSPTQLTEDVKKQALGVRAALESSGLDHGPISVHDKMRALGMSPVPSIASLARIFRQAGVARLEPRKRPRASWRRFVYPAPNACWQLDATEYVLTGGRKCVILQLIDDHSRYAVASHVAWGETSDAAIAVFDKAVAAHGVPQRLLSDNGLALNPSRRGILGQLVVHLMELGVEPITGKPYKPTTQGKNERFHQTLFRFLDKQPLAATLAELQVQVDAFDHLYNTERPHQGLPGRMTPQQAWDATPPAEAPRPSRERLTRTRIPRPAPQPVPDDLPKDTITKKLTSAGVFFLGKVQYRLGAIHGFKQVLIVTNGDQITVTDLDGEVLAEFTRPEPGVKYVGNGRRPGQRYKNPETSPKS
jgi:transposase InsO family protein